MLALKKREEKKKFYKNNTFKISKIFEDLYFIYINIYVTNKRKLNVTIKS